jgi:hypothetical protein
MPAKLPYRALGAFWRVSKAGEKPQRLEANRQRPIRSSSIGESKTLASTGQLRIPQRRTRDGLGGFFLHTVARAVGPRRIYQQQRQLSTPVGHVWRLLGRGRRMGIGPTSPPPVNDRAPVDSEGWCCCTHTITARSFGAPDADADSSRVRSELFHRFKIAR